MAGGPAPGARQRRASCVGCRIFRGSVRCARGCSCRLGHGCQFPGGSGGDDPRAHAQPGRCARRGMVSRPGWWVPTAVGVREGPGIVGAGGCWRLSARTRSVRAGQRSPTACPRRAPERVVRQMMRGQSLVELALCTPVVLLLTLGAVATVQIVDAGSGLEAATQAAAAVAARAPNPASVQAAAHARFSSIVAGYPLGSTTLHVTLGGFSRTDQVVAVSAGTVDVSWAALVLPGRLLLQARAIVPLETWRSRGTSP